MKLSIIIPFYNEEENVSFVVNEVKDLYPDAEIITVDDGSSDNTANNLRQIPGIIVHSFSKNLGQSAAVYQGLQMATREICVIMDGDGQNDPSYISKLLEKFPEYDLVNGYRMNRQDSWSKRKASKFANGIRNLFFADGMRDTGCTPKALKRECVPYLVPFNGLHRFIPALLKSAGFHITEVGIQHRPRLHGVSKYTNWKRALRGIYDLFGVKWLISRRPIWPRK